MDASGFNSLVWSVAGAAVLSLLAVLVRITLKISRAVSIFLEDWMGEPARPGVQARPGVMERIEVSEDRLDEVDERLNGVEARLGGVERHVGRLMVEDRSAGGEGLLGGSRRVG